MTQSMPAPRPTGASLSIVFVASNVTCDAKFRLLGIQAHARITVHITTSATESYMISRTMDQVLNTK